MRTFVKSIKRLYQSRSDVVTLEYLNVKLEEEIITQEEYNYIIA